MATLKKYTLEGDTVPQAIFWRPLNYFAFSIIEGEDGLDLFQGASFAIGNNIRFDLRTYRKHHRFTVTLYLPGELEDEAEISRVIKIVIKDLIVPRDAVAWRRGEAFKFGQLKRPKTDRLREAEARILALKIASLRPNRTASTEEIKRKVPSYIELSPRDLAQSTTRPKEKMWQQIVGNVISHKGSPSGLFLNGYARRTSDGLSVTDKGMDYLKSMGFFDSFTALAE
jgi:hypothetical protein